MDYEKYRQAIRKKVCEHCVDWGQNGRCVLASDHPCGIEIYLEKIVDVVHAVHSGNVKDYVDVLRKKVCIDCRNEKADHTCELRTAADCGLDRFFELV